MKKVFTLFVIILIVTLTATLASCGNVTSVGDDNTADGNNTTDTERVSDEVDVGQNEIVEDVETPASIANVADALVDELTEEQQNATLSEEYITGTYAITEEGTYYFTGELTDVITVAKNAGNVHIYLDNVTATAANKSVIASKKGAYVTITLIGENTLTNSGETAKHVIDSKENLVVNGSGTLTINSTKSAIACDNTFIGLGGTINVTAQKHAVTADSVYLDTITINATYCGKDVIHAESDYDEVETAPTFDYEKGYVYIENATITTETVYGDGIQADSFVYIKSGTFDLTTTPTWNNAYVATENQEKGMYNVSTHQKVAKDSVRAGSTYAVLEESVKGIKVGEIDYYLATDTEQENELTVESDQYAIVIAGGTFNINTVDDAIHANSGSVTVSGGNITINTSDDGIHADNNLKIEGNAVITIETSYEGIEAETINITGGTTTINAVDDGVNATNSNLTESEQAKVCQINVSGGRLDVTVSPNGDRDGIDSNGGIKITGGTVITRGPNNQNASPMDAANGISIAGGTVIVIGNTLGSSGGMGGMGGPGGGRGGMGGPGGGMNEGTVTISSSVTKTQSSSQGLSAGSHTIEVNGTTITYTNAYNYSGYTTVYASASATIK